jgi:hypothetical protein
MSVKQKVKDTYMLKNPVKKKITQTTEMCTFCCQSQPRATMKGGAAMMPNNVLLSRIFRRAKAGYVSKGILWANARSYLWISNTSVSLYRLCQTVIRPASANKATQCTPLYTQNTTTIRQNCRERRRLNSNS